MATSPDATQQPQTFVNPVLSGFNPDPSVVRVGNDFFLATSTFEYFPGVPLYHSRDLVNWRLIGHALTRKSQLEMRTVETGGGIWAPTLRCHDGYFYLATCKWDRYRPQSDVSCYLLSIEEFTFARGSLLVTCLVVITPFHNVRTKFAVSVLFVCFDL